MDGVTITIFGAYPKSYAGKPPDTALPHAGSCARGDYSKKPNGAKPFSGPCHVLQLRQYGRKTHDFQGIG